MTAKLPGSHTGYRGPASTNPDGRGRSVQKSDTVDGTGNVPPVPAQGSQQREEGGKFLSDSTANQTPNGTQLDGQVQRPGSVDGPGVDREGSASR